VSHSVKQSLKITADPYTDAHSTLTVAFLLFSLIVISRMFFPALCQARFPALNSVLASVTPLRPAQKTYNLPGLSNPTPFLLTGTKIQYLASTLRKERLAEITTFICSIRVSL
jgi:hypothetical protein